MLMTLPRDDTDFATRIMLVKQGFSRKVPRGERISAYRRQRDDRGLWQRRYWEHQIRNEPDFELHVDYIHFNPVKHDWALRPIDWPHSSNHRYVQQGLPDAGWAMAEGTEGQSRE